MIARPRIKSKYHIQEVAGEGIFLLAEDERHVLHGESLRCLLPLLNGQRTWAELLAAIEPAVGRDGALEAFDVLTRHGHVEEGEGALPPHLQAFWTELGKSAPQAQALMASTNVTVLAVGRADAAMFDQAVRSFGLGRDDRVAPSVLAVVTDDYLRPELAAINRHCLDHGVPWMLVKPSGLTSFVGPFFRPGSTACWSCLATRLADNREVERFVFRKTGGMQVPETTRMSVGVAELQAVSMATIQLVRWLATGSNDALESRMIAVNVLAAQQTSHTVVRRPQCRDCGDPTLSLVGGRPVTLQPDIHTVRGSNGIRAESAELTYERYAHHVSEYTGAVKSLVPSIWHGAGPIKVYVAGHNFALKNDELGILEDGLRSASSGKGTTDAQARTSALCEALERYSGVWRGEAAVHQASFADLGGDAVDPRQIALFSDRQYQERDDWNNRNSRFQVVPERFDETEPMHWSPVWSLTEQRQKWAFTSQMYYGFSHPGERFCFWGDSNGAAAGSTLEDAILQGFLELVERDSVALWWYNRCARPQVDLDSLGDRYLDDARAFYEQHGRSLWVLDLTSDLGIPVFVAVSHRVDAPTEDIVFGFGAHLDARIGISRAVTEMNQFMPAVLSVGPDGTTDYTFGDEETRYWWQTGTMEINPYLLPSSEPAKPIGALPALHDPDLRSQLETCFERVTDKGHEVLVLDQTRPDIGLPVVKVIVPGLRHFWARYAPGRLYDVPVELGWQSEPTAEEDLNPVALFV